MKLQDIFKYILGALIVIGFFGTMILLITKNPDDNRLDLLIGALIASFSTLVGYYWGSSSSSMVKDKTISDALNKSKTGEDHEESKGCD
jgi:hypothetical protein